MVSFSNCEIGEVKIYINGADDRKFKHLDRLAQAALLLNLILLVQAGGGQYFTIGRIDELAGWNTGTFSRCITDIYNATANNTGKALDLSTDSGNYTNSSSLQYWNRLGLKLNKIMSTKYIASNWRLPNQENSSKNDNYGLTFDGTSEHINCIF